MMQEGISVDQIQFGKRLLSGSVAIIQVCVLLEFLSYISIYWSLTEQNKSFIKIVQDDVLKKRAKKNIITLTGQALTFIVELTYSMFAQLLIHYGPELGVFVSGVLPCGLIVTMAAYTTTQILSSPELRRFIQLK